MTARTAFSEEISAHALGSSSSPPSLSICLPALNEARNLQTLLPSIHKVVQRLTDRYEILVVDGGSHDGTAEIAERLGARVITQRAPGYGAALQEGLAYAQGSYIVTMDADFSHAPEFIGDLWRRRQEAEVIIASRYVPGGSAKMPPLRHLLSRLLNRAFAQGLSLRVRDMSSGFRLYRARVLRDLKLTARDFDVLQEILVKAYCQGWRVLEVPFHYAPRRDGSSHARLWQFGVSYARTFLNLWRLRNSLDAADYEERAYESVVLPQRLWQRQRHHIIRELITASRPQRVLDVGCGSSPMRRTVPGAIGVDIQVQKVRYQRRYASPVLAADISHLPFRENSFDCLICSEVIEHLPAGDAPFLEMRRVLRPGGKLILATPDYGRLSWKLLNKAYQRLTPGGYADEHLTHYRAEELRAYLDGLGFRWLSTRYVFGSEMILWLEMAGTFSSP